MRIRHEATTPRRKRERRGWNRMEETFLRDNARSMSPEDMAYELDRTPSAIKTKLSLLGLKTKQGVPRG